MLEALVSSRVRRTLFEYLLGHPHDRFYLRGLAKELGLSVSPLRRELKRLERSGMLKTAQEANIVFYIVNTASPSFLQLKQATLPAATLQSVGHGSAQAPYQAGTGQAGRQPATAPSPVGATLASPIPTAVAVEQETPPHTNGHRGKAGLSIWTSPLRTPVMIGAASVGMALILIVGGLFYLLTMTNQHLMSTMAQRALTPREPVASSSSASGLPAPARFASQSEAAGAQAGVMQGNRWQLVPGGFGGFSTGANREVY